MDPNIVEEIQGEIELAIVRVIVKIGVLLPSHHAVHLMAKAAAAVYEAAVENQRRDRLGDDRKCDGPTLTTE